MQRGQETGRVGGRLKSACVCVSNPGLCLNN